MNASIEDPDEVKVYCEDCNGYLFSDSVYDRDPKRNLIPCPMQKDSSGRCTGSYPRRVHLSIQS